MLQGRGIAAIRGTAGVMTTLGVVFVLIAFVIVPAGPVLAADPLLETSIRCDDEVNTISWTASSSDPSPDGGTADGAVRVVAQRDLSGVITSFTIATGEFNDANGYSMSGDFQPWINRIDWRIIVEVDAFNDGSGVDSVVEGDWIYVPHCKDGTTSTTEGTTTTSTPVTESAEVTAACVLDNGVATYPITVTVTGEEAATGTVTINGVDTAYVIDADGSIEVTADGVAGVNTVVVTDDVAGELLNEELVLEDCTPPTTTIPVTLSASAEGGCVLDGDIATYPIVVIINGDAGATGTVTVNGVDTPYVIDAGGTASIDASGMAGDNTVVVTDDQVGVIFNQVLAFEDCSPPTTTTTETTATTIETTTTTVAETTTTTDSSSGNGTTPVSVLPTEIDQTELPQTGIDNGPLAGIGMALVLGGAGMLIAIRRQESLSS